MRLLFRSGTVIDGTGARPAVADVVVDDGRIVEVGPGLVGDEGERIGAVYQAGARVA